MKKRYQKMNGIDALKLLKLGSKVRKINWKDGWYIKLSCHHVTDHDLSSYYVSYSKTMKEDLTNNDQFKYFDVIEDIIYTNWETYEDDRQ